jgi:hypothetical protein
LILDFLLRFGVNQVEIDANAVAAGDGLDGWEPNEGDAGDLRAVIVGEASARRRRSPPTSDDPRES